MRQTITMRMTKMLLLAFCIYMTPTAAGQDVELTDVAQKLLRSLEAKQQTSGTVLDFTDLQGSPTELGRYLAQELSDRMVSESQSFSLVDRANLQYLLREHKLSVEGLVNPETTRKLGQLIGIDTVLLGTTTPLGDSIRLSVRAIDVETAKIMASQTTTLPATAGLRTLYNRGVAGGGTSMGAEAGSAGQSALPFRQLLRDGALKVEVNNFEVDRSGNLLGISYSVENLSGTSFQISFYVNSSRIGLCDFSSSAGVRSTGIDIGPSRYQGEYGTWLEVGQKIQASATYLGYCHPNRISANSAHELTLTFGLVRDDEKVKKTVTFPNVKVRDVGRSY